MAQNNNMGVKCRKRLVGLPSYPARQISIKAMVAVDTEQPVDDRE